MKDAIRTRSPREEQVAYIMQKVRNEIQHALLLFAPDRMPDERLEQIEEQVMHDARMRLGSLTDDEISSAPVRNHHIWIAEAETKNLIHGCDVLRS